MAELTVTSATAADGTFSAAGTTVWNAGMQASAGQLSAVRGGTGLDTSALTGVVTVSAGAWSVGNALDGVTIGGVTPAAGTFTAITNSALTSGRVVLSGTGGLEKDDSGLTFAGTGATFVLTVGKQIITANGNATSPAYRGTSITGSGMYFGGDNSEAVLFSDNQNPIAGVLGGGGGLILNANSASLGFSVGIAWHTTLGVSASRDTSISRISAGLVSVDTTVVGNFAGSLKLTTLSMNAAGASLGAVTSADAIVKNVTGIQDNTATATFTVTIPNAAHSASIKVILSGSMGAGGAIGANESTQGAEYDIDVTRTAGVNAVAVIGAAIGVPGAATVAGGDNVAVTAALSAIAGAVGATNTFTVNVTIAKVGIHNGNNHTCLCYALLMNANASGITIS